ncbi:MAG: NAD(P)H-dependent glycerol-3-phosphate dehydrogenase [Planctomycetaceae bacterium]
MVAANLVGYSECAEFKAADIPWSKGLPLMSSKITILGGGAMATACGILLAEKPDQEVTIWARNPDYARDMQQSRENKRLLPGVPISDGITVTSDINKAVADASLLVASIPTKHLRGGLEAIKDCVLADTPVVSVIKGIENDSFLRPSEVICDVLGPRDVVALGGPSHAEEIARRLPASVVAASGNIDLAKSVQGAFTTERFRVYTNKDLVGVELAGALKNVIAIAAGICDGIGYGDNAKSALMTRGLVEIIRFGVKLGAQVETFSGLAGIGDLITTCTSSHGRNRRVGELLGQGKTREQIIDEMVAVAEGLTTTSSIVDLAEKHDIEMPITREVHAVLFEGKSPKQATDDLMCRPSRSE